MENLLIEFETDDIYVKEVLENNFGPGIKEEFIESNNFHGDIMVLITTVIIPIAMPIVQVLFEKYLNRKESLTKSKTVRFRLQGKTIEFNNYSKEEIVEVIKLISKSEK